MSWARYRVFCISHLSRAYFVRLSDARNSAISFECIKSDFQCLWTSASMRNRVVNKRASDHMKRGFKQWSWGCPSLGLVNYRTLLGWVKRSQPWDIREFPHYFGDLSKLPADRQKQHVSKCDFASGINQFHWLQDYLNKRHLYSLYWVEYFIDAPSFIGTRWPLWRLTVIGYRQDTIERDSSQYRVRCGTPALELEVWNVK